MILRDIEMTGRCLSQRAHAKKQAIALPSFLIDLKHRYAAGRAHQAGLETARSLFTAKSFREGENPARWRGHLDHLLPPRSKLSRGHHAAMPYEEVAAFIAALREREAVSALALELCILTAARSGEILGMRWSEVGLEKKI